MTTVTELITHLQRYYQPDDTIAAPIWQVDDVICRANEIGKCVTHEDAENIIEAMEHQHDACLGITWDTIDCHLLEMPEQTAEAGAA